MDNIKINAYGLDECVFKIDACHLADILLNSDIDIQSAFAKRTFSRLADNNMCELAEEIGRNELAYLGLRKLYEYSDNVYQKMLKRREAYENSPQRKREKEYEDKLFEYSPDGRPW